MGKFCDNFFVMKVVKSFWIWIKELEVLLVEGMDIVKVVLVFKLDKEWDIFLYDEEWKKKVDYDD